MKRCPECSTEYADSTNFCAKDGRALATQVTSRSRLCPHCANSIAEDATKCPYCMADLSGSPAPQWPHRQEESRETKVPREGRRIPTTSKAIFIAGVGVLALAIYLFAGYQERSGSQAALQQKLGDLQQKEQALQASEQKIQTLEKQLAQARQELGGKDAELSNLKTKLEESKKDLSVAQQRLGIANREIDRLASSRSQLGAKSPPRSAEPVSSPGPVASARRAAAAGTYETVRSTAVHEDPSPSGRVLSQIGKGTRVDVVRSVGEWLEVRSKHGNPPGYIRIDDAMLVSK